jgi:hypothetical protein
VLTELDRSDARRFSADRLVTRVRGHWAWAREHGLAAAAREDAGRARAELRRYRWRRRNHVAPHAVPVYLVGIQRSGTEMLLEGFNECPEIQIYNEKEDSAAFHEFKLRNDEVIRGLIMSSGHRCVIFKSLCDAHRVLHLMEGLRTPSTGRAIWIYRRMEGRVRSTLARWPDNNLRVLREIAQGRSIGHWEAEGLSSESLDLIRSFDYETLTRESAAALLWYVRNALFFELGLDRRNDVRLTSYERFLARPEGMMRDLCDFLGVSYDKGMTAHIGPRPPATKAPLEIDPEILTRCSRLQTRLDAAFEASEH